MVVVAPIPAGSLLGGERRGAPLRLKRGVVAVTTAGEPSARYSPAQVAIDYFLKLDGIPGESADAKHKGEIDVLAFSWGVSQTGSSAPGGGGGAGRALFEDLLVVARTSKASPKLWQACASGQHVKTAVLVCRRGTGKGRVEFLKITLEEVTVTSYEIDGSDEEPPVDQIALAFGKVRTEFVSVDSKGTAQPAVTTAWDLKKNAKV